MLTLPVRSRITGGLQFHTYLVLALYAVVMFLPLHQDISPSAPDSDNPSTSPCELLRLVMAHDTAAKTAKPATAPVISRPIDLGTVSILTLPAEIRNAIYEALFCRGELLLLYERTEDDVPLRPAPQTHGIAALLTCRQIHEEASPFLYSRNTIVFAVKEYKHDINKHNINCTAFYDLPSATFNWLTHIGQQRGRVRSVVIDLQTLRTECVCPTQPLSLTPLLQQISLTPDRKLPITFRPLTSQAMGMTTTGCFGRVPWVADVAKMNQILFDLDPEHFSPLRPFVRCRRTFHTTCGLAGSWVGFAVNGGYTSFDRSPSGTYTKRSRADHLPPRPDLYETLQKHTINGKSVPELIFGPAEELVFDLDEHSVNPALPVTMSTSSELRRLTLELYFPRVKIIALTVTHSPRAWFNGFDHLRKWVQVGWLKEFISAGRGTWLPSMYGSTTIVLGYNLQVPVSRRCAVQCSRSNLGNVQSGWTASLILGLRSGRYPAKSCSTTTSSGDHLICWMTETRWQYDYTRISNYGKPDLPEVLNATPRP
jgi:hypothetical protein